MTILFQSYAKHGQGVRWISHREVLGRRLRIVVHLDTSYRHQSKGSVDVWVEGRGMERVIDAYPEELSVVGKYFDAQPGQRGEMERGDGLSKAMEHTVNELLNRALALTGGAKR